MGYADMCNSGNPACGDFFSLLQYLQPQGYLDGFQLYVPHIHYILSSLHVHVRYVKYLVLCYLFSAPSFSSRLLS